MDFGSALRASIQRPSLQKTSIHRPSTLWTAALRALPALATLSFLSLAPGCSLLSGPGGGGMTFQTPEAAAGALADALRASDATALERVLGPDSGPLVDSGDAVADAAGRRRFLELFEEGSRVEHRTPEFAVVHVGELDWPLPIPVVKDGDTWRFDCDEGMEELLNRRIGRNELAAIQVCLAVVDAQREFHAEDPDGDGRRAYAARFGSSPGKKDGLYWPSAEGEPSSPLGLLAAQAAAEGYSPSGDPGDPMPYHGYCFRLLKAQGPSAGGGAMEFTEGGALTRGFALVAYPAEYGASGIMTFIVNQDGILFQRDLGEETRKVAKAMEVYDPDSAWSTVDAVSLP